MLSWIFRALRLGGVLTSPQAAPSGLQMTPPSHLGSGNPRKSGSPDFILISNLYPMKVKKAVVMSLKELSLFCLVINSNYDLVLLNISFKAIPTAFFGFNATDTPNR